MAAALPFQKLLKLISEISEKKILITFHYAGDFDALSSAFCLKKILKKIDKKNKVWVVPPSVSGTEEKLFISRGYFFDSHDFDVDYIFVVDTNSRVMLEDIFEGISTSKAKKIVIDHHVAKEVDFADYSFIDEKAAATSEIIYDILDGLGIIPDKEMALLLASGIVTDSANFVAANPRTFLILHELLTSGGVSFQDVLENIRVPEDISKKIARIKAASRLKLTRVNDYLIVHTTVSAHEGSTANAILGLGADVVFVGSTNEGLRLSSRARGTLVKKGLNLGRDIMPKIGELIGGEGGGHAGAAGANGEKKELLEKAIKECVSLTSKIIKEM